jgi:dCMP deaminase
MYVPTRKWDNYWLGLCNQIASNSKCLSRTVGAIIVKDYRYIVSTGYNGPLAGMPHCDDRDYRKWLFIGTIAIKDKDFKFPSDINKLVLSKSCPRKDLGLDSGTGLEYCQACHAEVNAITTAARLGHSTEGCSMFINCDVVCCLNCAKNVIASGIKEVVATSLNHYETKGISGLDILAKAGLRVRTYLK